MLVLVIIVDHSSLLVGSVAIVDYSSLLVGRHCWSLVVTGQSSLLITRRLLVRRHCAEVGLKVPVSFTIRCHSQIVLASFVGHHL